MINARPKAHLSNEMRTLSVAGVYSGLVLKVSFTAGERPILNVSWHVVRAANQVIYVLAVVWARH